MTASKWSQAEAIAFCREIEAVCPAFGCHVALTGGTLYKDGPRKDCDVLFYRIRQVAEIDTDGLFEALSHIGLERTTGFGWCIKAEYQGRNIDCFFPEEQGEYERGDPADMPVDEDWIREEVEAMGMTYTPSENEEAPL